MTPGKIFTITAQGAEESLRGARDGVTYFGSKKRAAKSSIHLRKADVLNDIVIKAKDAETAERHRGRHFQIRYCIESNNYKIRDLGAGYGAYARLDNPLLLKDNYLLSMGESFFIVNLVQDAGIEKRISGDGSNLSGNAGTKLRIKVFSGPSNGEILYCSRDC